MMERVKRQLAEVTCGFTDNNGKRLINAEVMRPSVGKKPWAF